MTPAVPVVVGKDGWLFAVWDNVGWIDPAILKHVAQTVGSTVAMFRKAGIQTAICLLPSKSRVYADFLPADQRRVPSIERLYEHGLKALTATGAITFDMANFLKACRQTAPDKDLYFKADTHWLPVGAGSAAAEMARYIKASANLPPSAAPGVTLSAPLYGQLAYHDLGDLLPRAMQGPYPYQRYLKREPVSKGAASLLDADTSDVVVVGNSFMQPEFGYAATLSSELNRPVGLAWRVHQFSPYWNMLDYLKSPSFTERRPKLIVWTFHEMDLNTRVDSKDVWLDTAMGASDFLANLVPLLG
jgi:alginate O-acetyltransferase complex protein AlgJ